MKVVAHITTKGVVIFVVCEISALLMGLTFC